LGGSRNNRPWMNKRSLDESGRKDRTRLPNTNLHVWRARNVREATHQPAHKKKAKKDKTVELGNSTHGTIWQESKGLGTRP